MKLAFVGLGNMGMPMALNLVKAYPEVYGLNRSKGKEEAFARSGGKTGLPLRELAKQADILMTCLPLPRDVEEVYLGEEGIYFWGRPGLVAIDFSTVSPRLSQRVSAALKEKGIHFLDAPISGGPPGAKAATLSIMVGGEEAVFQRVKPVLEVLGKHIYYVGPSGSGSAVKLLNQLMVSIHTLAASEALFLAQKLGLSLDQVVTILSNSFAQSRILERHYSQFIAQENYQPGFALNLLHKDSRLVEELAQSLGVDLPVASQVNQLLGQAEAAGYGPEDMASMFKYVTGHHQQKGKEER